MTRPPRENLRRLLHPRQVAFVGGDAAAEALRQSLAVGYAGEMWPVNPRRREVEGRPCYRSVEDLPAAPDAALVAVPAAATPGVVAALAARGAGGCVCFAGGFAEAGPKGQALQQRLVEAAGGMALVGPNCNGLLNYLDGAALWPDQQGGERAERGVALVSQSGNVAIDLTMQDRSLPLSYVVSVGNQAVLGVGDIVDGLLDDPRVTAIGLFVEGLGDLARFADAARRALDRGVPLVALKVGASEAGARAVVTHTDALAGTDALYRALFDRLGVIRVDTPAELLETAKLLAIAGVPAGRRLVSLSCSGGEAALVADLAAHTELELPAPGAEAAAAAARHLRVAPESVGNPLDYNTTVWGQGAALADGFEAMLAGGCDMGLLVLDLPRPERCRRETWWTALDAFAEAKRRTGVYAAVASMLSEGLPAAARTRAAAAGIAPLQDLDAALRALGHAARYARRRRELAGAPPYRPEPALRPPGEPAVLDEARGKAALAAAGVPVPPGRLAAPDEAPAAAADLGFPVAVKGLAEGSAHKSEAGLLALNLTGEAAVAAAAERIAAALTGRGCAARGLLVERMVSDAVAELIAAVRNDAQFGPVLVLGSGGVLAELAGDVRTLLLPAPRREVAEALAALKVGRLLHGWRGGPAGDLEAAVDAVAALCDFATARRGHLLDVEVNPLLVRPTGGGAVAADVVIRYVGAPDAVQAERP